MNEQTPFSTIEEIPTPGKNVKPSFARRALSAGKQLWRDFEQLRKDNDEFEWEVEEELRARGVEYSPLLDGFTSMNPLLRVIFSSEGQKWKDAEDAVLKRREERAEALKLDNSTSSPER